MVSLAYLKAHVPVAVLATKDPAAIASEAGVLRRLRRRDQQHGGDVHAERQHDQLQYSVRSS